MDYKSPDPQKVNKERTRTMKIVLYEMPDEVMPLALQLAQTFCSEFPDRIGVRSGVGYVKDNFSYYVYRTETSVIVRGNKIED